MSLKTAVITGANRGLGLEMVRQLCADEAFGHIYALCRKTSDDLNKLSSSSSEKVIVIEDIDVSKDDVMDTLKRKFSPPINEEQVKIHLLINNAGALGPPEEFPDLQSVFASQKLENITMDRMRYPFELNTLGPLRVTKALLPNLELAAAAAESSSSDSPSKIIIITSLVGSIGDNCSGNLYGYRTSKAGVNMIGHSLAMNLKDKNIAVGLIHPGMVATGFGDVTKFGRLPGQRDIEPSVKGVFEAIDAVTMETTGSFYHGNYGEGIKVCPW